MPLHAQAPRLVPVALLQAGAYYSAAARLGGTGCEATAWVSASALHCSAAAGVGGSLALAVTAAQRAGSVAAALSFDAVALKGSVRGHGIFMADRLAVNLPRAGGDELVKLAGKLPRGYSPQARAGGSACAATAWLAGTALVCRAGPGAGAALPLALTVAALEATATRVYSYDVPALRLLVGGGNLAAAPAAAPVAVTGSLGFAPSAAARVGGTACAASEWASDSALLCRAAPGRGGLLAVSLTAAAPAATLSFAATYDAPLLRAAGVERNARPSGGAWVLATLAGGSGAEASGRVRAGASACEASVWDSATAVRCTVSAGWGVRQPLTATLAARAATVTEALSYDFAGGLALLGGAAGGGLGPGRAELTLHGAHFGASDATPRARGATACEWTRWSAASSLACRMAPGVVRAAGVAVTLAAQTDTLSRAWSFDALAALAVAGGNAPPSGGDFVAVSGSALDLRQHSLGVRVGGTAAERSAWVSDTSAAARAAPGAAATLQVAVTAALAVATGAAGAFSFDAPAVRGLDIARDPADPARQRTVLRGAGFGRADTSPRARVGDTACAETAWTSDSAVACGSAPLLGAGASLTAALTVGGQRAALCEDLSGGLPAATALAPSNLPVAGAPRALSVLGRNFGAALACVGARVGGTAAESTRWLSASSLALRVARGAGRATGTWLVLTVQGLRATAPLALSFDAPAPAPGGARNLPASGGAAATLAGQNLGAADLSPRLRVGASACGASAWAADTAVTCRAPAGVAAGAAALVVTMARAAATAPRALSYDRPALLGAAPGNAQPRPRAGAQLRVGAEGLGQWDASPAARLGRSACAATVWLSHTALACAPGAGAGGALALAVTLARAAASAPAAFSYDAPGGVRRAAAAPGNFPGAGGAGGAPAPLLRLALSGGLPGGYSPAAALGGSACPATAWGSEAEVTARAPAGAGLLLSAAVTLAAQVPPAPLPTRAASLAAGCSLTSGAHPPCYGRVFFVPQ